MSKVLRGWEEFERVLINQRYSIRDPETGERTEKTYEDVIDRISNHFESFKEIPISKEIILKALSRARKREFTFATPILMNFGNPHTNRCGFYSCFPLGPVPDSTEDILKYIQACTVIFQHAGGVGLDFSSLRPKGSGVDHSQGESSGPVGFIPMFESTAKSIAAGGKRRGAMLGQLDYNHQDIFDFVRLKRNRRDLWSINISVNAFGDFWSQKELIKEIAIGMWTSGDPGLLFSDEITLSSPYPKELKPLARYVNPCSEFCSPPFSVCHLLTGSALSAKSVSDFETLGYYMTHIGNAILWITLTTGKGIPQSPAWLRNKLLDRINQLHPVGVGLTGIAEYLYREKLPYTDLETIQLIYSNLAKGSLKASAEWCQATKEEVEWDPEYKSRHLAQINYSSNKTSFWNTTTLSQAPAGSVSQFLRCLTTGIEPLETFEIERRFFNDKDKFQSVKLVSLVKPDSSRPLKLISPEDQIRVVSVVQSISHTSASKTINIPKEATVDDIIDIINIAQKYRLKGLTVYRRGCALEEIVSTSKAKQVEDTLTGITYKFKGLNSIYITVNRSSEGNLIEVFVTTGKSGSAVNGLAMGLGRLISLALKSGTKPDTIVKSLIGIETGDYYLHSKLGRVSSICDAVAKVIQNILKEDKKDAVLKEEFDLCPQCQSFSLTRNGQGCKSCIKCGYSTC